MRRLMDNLLAELAVPLVQVSHDGFVFLTDQGDKIRPAVVIEIAYRHVNSAVPRIHDMRHEHGPGPVGGAIFKIGDLSAVPPAEDGHDQVELAVAVEVGDLDVGDAADSFQESDGREAAVGSAAQPDDAAHPAVCGRETSQAGDDDVEYAVSIQVDDFRVRGIGHFG